MPVPNTFANATATIPLSQLDANFATTITLGNTAIQLGNTVTTLNNMTLANVTVSSGNVTVTNVSITTANVTTANIATAIITTADITTANVTTANITTGNVSGNLTFTGTGNRILGDFSNATVANRVMFQTSTVNGNTLLGVIPNGTATSSGINLFNGTDTANASTLNLNSSSTAINISATATGTGTLLPMVFRTGGTDQMRLDTSGNLGLGVTPSAWAGGQKALQFGIGGALFGDSSTPTAQVSSNTFFDGSNYKYIASAATSRFVQVGGEFTWNNAASGTAGNTVTFSERMRLDASGNLGIGTTTPITSTARLSVRANGDFDAGLAIGSNASAVNWARLDFKNTNAAQTAILYQDQTGLFAIRTEGAYPITFNTNSANERMRITSAGDVGIGTSSPQAKLEVNGAIQLSTTNQIQFFTSSYSIRASTGLEIATNDFIRFLQTGVGERVRIDSSGFTQFSSNLVMPYQGAPTSKAAAATLTGAELITGILNTTGTTYTITLPTGANIEAALTWVTNNVSLDWWVINTASGTITIGANGNTTLGSLTIATGTSAHFRIRRTAANTFTVYRL